MGGSRHDRIAALVRARLLAALRGLLLIWGALSLAGVVGVGLSASYRYGRGNRDQVDSASAGDVGFVLNWCGLGADRIAEVVHSYVSARSITGDHLDAYAIRISRIDPTELTPPSMPSASQWYPGDQLPPVVSDAVDFVGGGSTTNTFRGFRKKPSCDLAPCSSTRGSSTSTAPCPSAWS